MKIIICGSVTAAQEILDIQKAWKHKATKWNSTWVKNKEFWERTELPNTEKADDKIKHDLIRGYYEKIKQYDAVLVVNVEKRE